MVFTVRLAVEPLVEPSAYAVAVGSNCSLTVLVLSIIPRLLGLEFASFPTLVIKVVGSKVFIYENY